MQGQTIGLVLVLIGARWNDGLASALRAGRVLSRWTRTEKHAIAVLGWHLVEELAQGFVTLALVAHLSGGDPVGAWADVGRAVFLTRVVQVASLGCIQAVVVLAKGSFTYTERGIAEKS